MNPILAANLEVLRRRFPEAAARVEEAARTTDGELIPTTSGLYDLNWRGRLLYGGDPAGCAEKALSGTKFVYPRLVVVYGVGLGHVAKRFYDLQLPDTKHILLVEKSPAVFRWALEAFDWRPMLEDERVHLMLDLKSEDRDDVILDYLNEPARLVSIRTLTTIYDEAALHLEEASQGFRNDYLETAGSLKRAADYLNGFVFCSPEDSYRGYMNLLQNLPEASGVPLFDSLEGLFKGQNVPGIAVSTGPSLKHSLSWLKEVQNRAAIVCVDSALHILLEHGIRPHAAVCLERVPETKLLFENIPPVPDIWLITTPVIWPETFRTYPGPKLMMMRAIAQLKWYWPEAELYEAGNSSSHLALAVLQKMGCSQAMIVGQDLAFDRHSQKTHVDGIPKLLYDLGQQQRSESQSDAEQSGRSECLVEGNDGRPILTMPWYNKFRRVLERLIRMGNIPCHNVIPAEYGAKIQQARHLDPSRALSLLEGLPTLDIAQRIRSRLKAQEGTKEIFLRRAQILNEKALAYLREYQNVCLEVLDSISIYRQRFSPVYFDENTYRPFFQKIEQIGNDLFADADEFHMTFFLAQVQDKTFALSQLSEELLTGKKTMTEKIEMQFDMIREWFSTTYYWAARMGRFLERQMALSPLIPEAKPEAEAGGF